MRSTAFVEARPMYGADGPEEMHPVGEVAFVQGLAAASANRLFERLSKGYSAAERAAMFRDSAARVHRIAG